MTTISNSKEQALKIAREHNIPIYNVEFKTASDILSEITLHQVEMRLLDDRTIKAVRNSVKNGVLSLANKYNIPYNKEKPDYTKIRNDLDYWNSLITRAKELNIEWDKSDYQPLYLRQEIEQAEHRSFQETRSLLNEYFDSIRLA